MAFGDGKGVKVKYSYLKGGIILGRRKFYYINYGRGVNEGFGREGKGSQIWPGVGRIEELFRRKVGQEQLNIRAGKGS